jgi:hypothetical protein
LKERIEQCSELRVYIQKKSNARQFDLKEKDQKFYQSTSNIKEQSSKSQEDFWRKIMVKNHGVRLDESQ